MQQLGADSHQTKDSFFRQWAMPEPLLPYFLLAPSGLLLQNGAQVTHQETESTTINSEVSTVRVKAWNAPGALGGSQAWGIPAMDREGMH